jgi:hypothetical protein
VLKLVVQDLADAFPGSAAGISEGEARIVRMRIPV